MKKHIALVAHDSKKPELISWFKNNIDALKGHQLYATGTTGTLIQAELDAIGGDQKVICFESGPLGGDQQIGAKITEGLIECLIFFWVPLEAQPHDPDVKALIRLAAVWNIGMACNETTATCLMQSPLLNPDFEQSKPDFTQYRARLKK